MKKLLTFFFLIFFQLQSWSQIIFEKGYIVDNNNQRLDCWIKDVEWKNNPTKIRYKLSESAAEQVGTLSTLNGFGIGDHTKYIKFNVEIDRSTEDLDELSKIKRPQFNEEVLFLKSLVEGKASLYEYVDGNLQRYFYQINGGMVNQLVYKLFLTNQTEVKTNERYKQQLKVDLNCKSMPDVAKLYYGEKKLTKFFKKYNECSNVEYQVFNQKKKAQFQIVLKPGVRWSSVLLRNDNSNLEIKVGPEMGYSFGISAELNLRFNKNKWAAILEPTFQTFKVEETTELFTRVRTDNVSYQSIEIPIGIRHYFFLNKSSKFFANGFIVFDFPRSVDVNGFSNNRLGLNLAFGGGYAFKSRFSLELRYHTRRDILKYYRTRYAGFNGFALVLGVGI